MGWGVGRDQYGTPGTPMLTSRPGKCQQNCNYTVECKWKIQRETSDSDGDDPGYRNSAFISLLHGHFNTTMHYDFICPACTEPRTHTRPSLMQTDLRNAALSTKNTILCCLFLCTSFYKHSTKCVFVFIQSKLD